MARGLKAAARAPERMTAALHSEPALDEDREFKRF